jgi:di-heme cytochrome c peroxidase
MANRKPQSHAYAPLSPVLHYNPGQGDLVGGNVWDMRATGRRLGNPAAEQAQGPPTNPVEMGLPDIACAVYRVAQRPYRTLFERVWAPQAFAISLKEKGRQVMFPSGLFVSPGSAAMGPGLCGGYLSDSLAAVAVQTYRCGLRLSPAA